MQLKGNAYVMIADEKRRRDIWEGKCRERGGEMKEMEGDEGGAGRGKGKNRSEEAAT